MRRSMSVVTSFVLAAGLVVGASPGASAATCEVTNAGTGTTYTTLQEAVDDAASGDALEVRGTCVGKTIIRATRLRLKGIPTTAESTPTLDGARIERVLTVVNAKVVIRDLAITNGAAWDGGGILTSQRWHKRPRPRVTLSGDASVTGNTAVVGGGMILNNGGSVTLNDSASVTGNTAIRVGGGIYKSAGILTLNDSASITGNTGEYGGGIFSDGTVTLSGAASVSGNTSSLGGGIYQSSGTVTLNDSASVTGNTAEVEGGGILPGDYPGPIYVCSDEVAISPNDPDDPPKVRHVCP